MATDLNLHRKTAVTSQDTEEGKARDIEVHNRERTWILCFCLDRSFSAQMGKPHSIIEECVCSILIAVILINTVYAAISYGMLRSGQGRPSQLRRIYRFVHMQYVFPFHFVCEENNFSCCSNCNEFSRAV
jgi:hypothetical protein